MRSERHRSGFFGGGGGDLQEVGDVRDVDTQLPVAVGQLARVQGVVDVAAARGVHAADADVAQVLTPRLLAVLLQSAGRPGRGGGGGSDRQ